MPYQLAPGPEGIMSVLASNFSGMTPLVFIVPVLFTLGIASFVPSARGHWAGPALAAPLVLGTLAFIVLQSSPDLGVYVWSMLLVPLGVAVGSVTLWVARRRSRAV